MGNNWDDVVRYTVVDLPPGISHAKPDVHIEPFVRERQDQVYVEDHVPCKLFFPDNVVEDDNCIGARTRQRKRVRS
jgi:hypothetical protein